MTTAVYIFDDIASFTDADLEVACSLVAPGRRDKAMRYVHTADRKLSAIAGLLLMRATGADESVLTTVANGKPAFADSSLPRFNLSHCSRAVACAVAAHDEVGVDVEPYDSYDEEVARVVFNATEQGRAVGHPEAFAELWTTKESYLKYTGAGLTDRLPELLCGVPGDLFATYHSPRGYACTLCTPGAQKLQPVIINKTTLLHG